MLLFKRIQDIENHLKGLKRMGLSIGFVPTMGALHQGHLSLLKNAQKRTKITVCSIFINPTQFNDPADFDKYPVTIEKDIEQLLENGCDILFLPSVKEMYPGGFENKTRIDFGFLAQTLEGEHRPGHFDGMAQIVEKLLRVVKPDMLFMGLKDYQQQLIVGELIRKRRLPVALVPLPTLREKDGLAMSSRNVRLDKVARRTSLGLSKVLAGVKQEIIKSRKTSKTQVEMLDAIQRKALTKLSNMKGVEVEYLQIRNANTLALPQKKTEKLVALVAAKVGGVRLIDNVLV